MNKQDKQRLYIFGGIIIAVVILFLLLRKTGAGNTIINQGGNLSVPTGEVAPISLGDLPSLDYQSPMVSARGCSVCYQGYSRINVPASPAPMPPAPSPTVNKYLYTTVITPPAPPPPTISAWEWSRGIAFG